jgi:GTP cyclohydrolase I
MVATALAPAGIDVYAAQKAVRDLLTALGQPIDDDTEDTPRRVAAAFNEMLTAPPFELTTFANDEHYDELVVVRDIPVQSLCAHHLLPFIGVAHVAYLPAERIVGLSKLARAVGMWSRGLQVQERLSSQIAGIEAEHLCMTLRGVQAHGARTVTSTLRGQVRDDPSTRAEFLGLARR